MSDRIDGLGIAVLLSAETEYGHWLFDQLVRTDQEGHREGKVKRFRHPIIDDQLKGDGLLNRNVSWLSAFEYLVDKIAVAAKLNLADLCHSTAIHPHRKTL